MTGMEGHLVTIDQARQQIEYSGACTLAPEIHCVLSELAEHEADPTIRLRELRRAYRMYQEMGARGHAERIGPLIAPPGEIVLHEPENPSDTTRAE